MSRKKILSEYSEDQLLNSLNQETEETPSLEYSNDIIKFFTFYNIEPGPHQITKKGLISLYRKWSEDPVNRFQFLVEVNKYLIEFSRGNRSYYKINQKALHLSAKAFKHINANKVDKRKSKTYRKHFESYLEHYNIQKGSYHMESEILYHLYDRWNYEHHRSNRLGEQQFMNYLGLYFESYKEREKDKTYYMVDKNNIKHLTTETISNIRVAERKKRERKKEKQQKIKNKISST